jgi:hypothetical protein
MECRHLNGNPSDNRPENLAWRTRLENMADQGRHGTRPQGRRHGMAKLTEDRVSVARALRRDGWTVQRIADLFGVSNPTMTVALNGRTWKHVERRVS